jgi:hypothetical protein
MFPSDAALRREQHVRAGAAIGIAAAAIAIGGATSLQPHLAVAGAAAAMLVAGALIVPLAWLPGSALVLFLALPTAYLPLPLLLSRFFTPSVIVFAVWAIRVLVTRRNAQPTAFGKWWGRVALGLTCWLLLGSLTSLSTQRSIAWVIVFGFTVLAAGAAAIASGDETRQSFERAWLWSALVFGALGCMEGVTHWNPLASHYEIDGIVITQHWSVYRIETTLGHPLMNALVFATLAAGAGMIALTRPRPLSVAAALCSAGAVTFTASRAGALALVLGIGVGVVCVFFSRTTRPAWRIAAVLGLVLAAVGVWSSPVLRHREASKEGQVSSADRYGLTDAAWRIVQHDSYAGSGPGTSQRRLEQDEPKTLVLENSPLQLLVSTGVPGALALATLLAGATRTAIRRRRWEGAAALVAAVVVSSGFNGWDQVPVTLVMLGAAIVLALTGDAKHAGPRNGPSSVPATNVEKPGMKEGSCSALPMRRRSATPTPVVRRMSGSGDRFSESRRKKR